MRMTLQLRPVQKQEQRLEQKLTMEQRFLLQSNLLALRMELVQILRRETYVPKAECPKCGRQLTPLEIIAGFNRDPNDYKTCCSGCGHRFEPTLICLAETGITIELPFYCDSQMLSQLQGKENLSPDKLAREYPAIYRSAIVHHGTIRAAFRKIGVDYKFDEISDWRDKIKPILGYLPDTTIAECVGVSPAAISSMRKKLGVKRYTTRNALHMASSSPEDRYYVLAKRFAYNIPPKRKKEEV